MRVLDDGYAISDRLEIGGEGSSFFVFAQGWLLEIVGIEEGDYYFFSNGEPIRPKSARFGVYYPPFAITRPYVNAVKGTVNGVGAITHFPQLPSTPFIFETDFDGEFASPSQAFDILSGCQNRRSIEVNTKPSLRPPHAVIHSRAESISKNAKTHSQKPYIIREQGE